MNIYPRKQRNWLFLPLLIFMLTACEKVVFEPVVIPNTDVSFTTDIQPIFDNKCVSCHPPTKGLDLNSEESYNELVPAYVSATDSVNPDASALYRKLVSTSHDPRTSDVEKAAIHKWISQGAPNN